MSLKYFKVEDFNCQETGENEMCPDFLQKLDALREVCGFPFIVTSGYRSPNHSIEAAKIFSGKPAGTHAQGIAADIKVVGGAQRMAIIRNASIMGFNGIGVAKGFVHVDTRETTPVAWKY
jgi:zinc D-Ala-D-Ala carboxypeptidase